MSRFWRASGNALLPGSHVLGPAGGGAAVTFNPTTGVNKNSEITLSGGNLHVAHGTTFNRAMVRATAPTSGTKIFKVTVTATDAGHGNMWIGIDDGTTDLSVVNVTPGRDNSAGMVVKLTGGGWNFWGVASKTGQTNYWDGGSVTFELRFNTAAHTFQIYRNGVLEADDTAATTFTLPTLSAYYAFGGMELDDQFTADFSGYS